MSRNTKIVILSGLLVSVSYLLGSAYKQVQKGHELVFAPSLELGVLVVWLLAGISAVAVVSGLAATLVRPLWAGAVASFVASLALLLGWEVRLGTGLLAVLYFAALAMYTGQTAKVLEERVHFSVRGVSEGFPLLLTALALIACGGVYFGYTARIEAEGFSIPRTLTDSFVDMIVQRIGPQMEGQEGLKAEERAKQLAEIRKQIDQMWVEPVENQLKRYARFVPALLALGFFWTLRTLLALLIWIPALVLKGLFPLLHLLQVTRVTRETREVERLVI